MRLLLCLSILVLASSFDVSQSTSKAITQSATSRMKMTAPPINRYEDGSHFFHHTPVYTQKSYIEKGLISNACVLQSIGDWEYFVDLHNNGTDFSRIYLKEPSNYNDIPLIMSITNSNDDYIRALAALIVPLNLDNATLDHLYDNLMIRLIEAAASNHEDTVILYLEGLLPRPKIISSFTNAFKHKSVVYTSNGPVSVRIASIRASEIEILTQENDYRLSALFNLIAVSPTLKSLDLRSLRFGEHGLNELSKLLQQSPAHNAFVHSLEMLTLRYVLLEQSNEDPILILLREAKRLSVFRLRFSVIGDEGAARIAQAAASNSHFPLRVIECAVCSLTLGLKAFVMPLIHSLNFIYLRGNEFHKKAIDEFVIAVDATLAPTNAVSPLIRLDLSHQKMQLLQFDAISVLRILNFFPRLNELDLRRGCLAENDLHQIVEALKQFESKFKWKKLTIFLPSYPSTLSEHSKTVYRNQVLHLEQRLAIKLEFESESATYLNGYSDLIDHPLGSQIEALK